jgi:hypothetical protein
MARKLQWTWIVNGQPTTVEPEREDTVFSLAARAIAQTGHLQSWSPDLWEARDWEGSFLPWSWLWGNVGPRIRRIERSKRWAKESSYLTEPMRRGCIFLNLRPEAGW